MCTSRTKGTTHASGMALSGTILGDLVSAVPLMFYSVSIVGIGTRFHLPRASTPLLDVNPIYTAQS